MTDKQPALFDWATELSDAQGHVTLSEQEAHEIGARLRRLHSENETLQAGYAAARLEIESLQARSVAPDPRPVVEMCAKALAEELAAWDIDPPLHHVKEAHDACELWLAAIDADRAMRAAQPAGAQQPAPSAAAVQTIPGVQWQCGPQANGFTSPQADSQPAPVVDSPLARRFGGCPSCGRSDCVAMSCTRADPADLLHIATRAPADSALKDHQIAALVNELRDIAIQYYGTQQLRERIARAVIPALKAQATDSVSAPVGGETYHLGACIVEDMLHATVMRKEPGRAGAVTVLLSEQIPVEHLQDRDVIVNATPPAQAADSVLEDAARLEFEMQHGSAIDAARKQGANHD